MQLLGFLLKHNTFKKDRFWNGHLSPKIDSHYISTLAILLNMFFPDRLGGADDRQDYLLELADSKGCRLYELGCVGAADCLKGLLPKS